MPRLALERGETSPIADNRGLVTRARSVDPTATYLEVTPLGCAEAPRYDVFEIARALRKMELAVGCSVSVQAAVACRTEVAEGRMISIENVSRRGFLKGVVGTVAFVLGVRLLPSHA